MGKDLVEGEIRQFANFTLSLNEGVISVVYGKIVNMAGVAEAIQAICDTIHVTNGLRIEIDLRETETFSNKVIKELTDDIIQLGRILSYQKIKEVVVFTPEVGSVIWMQIEVVNAMLGQSDKFKVKPD